MASFHALVIGVDHYEPNVGPDLKKVPDLAGSVNDALRMERYLREGPLSVPPERIRKLLSPGLFSEVERPAPDGLPTYSNIVAELRAMTRRVGDGDQVLIHFSGHGVRVPSETAAKGRGGRDEALVPLDGADWEGGVLRDVEIHRMLQDLSATGAYVTVILDACHSGSALRSYGETSVRVRGLGTRTGLWGPLESAVGSWGELYEGLDAAVQATHRPGYRHTGALSGWFPQPERCVLLAACRSPEHALERQFESVGVSGAFTHLLLEVLAEPRDEISYDALLGLVHGRLGSVGAPQMPVVEGDGALSFLGAGRRVEEPRVQAPGPNGEAGRRTEHRRRFAQVRDLSTPDASPLADALELEVFELQRKEDWENPGARTELDGRPARHGDLLCLLVRNRSDHLLNLVVLDVRPELAVERVHPKRDEGLWTSIEPGREQPIYLYAWVPDELVRVRTQLKLIAAAQRLDARHLELDPVDAAAGWSEWTPEAGLPSDDRWVVADLSLTVVR